jgi:hypothetical protein
LDKHPTVFAKVVKTPLAGVSPRLSMGVCVKPFIHTFHFIFPPGSVWIGTATRQKYGAGGEYYGHSVFHGVY